jgi:hypothetical protein
MNALLSQSMPMTRKHFMAFLHPPDPMAVRGIERPSFEVLQATFKWIYDIGPDSSVTLPFSLYFGMPIIGEKTRKGGRTIAQAIDDRLVCFHPPFLGIQHAWELCRNQNIKPILLNGIYRIWFYGLTAYNKEGGEFRPVMFRESEERPWRVDMVPWCTYSSDTDCLSFAAL